MSKHLTSQRYVFKIHSSRLRRAKWDLQLTVNQARENQELIALSESQMMRFIDELNGITNPELHIKEIKREIKQLKFETNLSISRPKIKKLYTELDKIRDKRESSIVTRQEKIATLQAQIDKVEAEFRQKLKDASRVADKLKTALVNANLRKTQQLELEKKRSAEQRQLMQESFSLQQQNFSMQKELQKAKEESAILRRELSAKIGPRRTASLFL